MNNWTTVKNRKPPKNKNKSIKSNKNNVTLLGKKVSKEFINTFFNDNSDTSDKLFTEPEYKPIWSTGPNRNKTPRNTNYKNYLSDPYLKIEKLDDIYKKNIETSLVSFFKEGYQTNISSEDSDQVILEYIKNFLIEHDIKISGGFILKGLDLFAGNTGLTSKDIDIYVPYTSLEKWNHINIILQKLFNVDMIDGKPHLKYMRTIFLTNRGMYSVTKHYKHNETIEMDIIRAIPSRTPIDIIYKFDLSFCKNWYDGENLWSFDKDATLKLRRGRLNNKNVIHFKRRNDSRGLARIKKYLNRGFGIEYYDPDTDSIIPIEYTNLNI